MFYVEYYTMFRLTIFHQILQRCKLSKMRQDLSLGQSYDVQY
jgi:hypothetical protein